MLNVDLQTRGNGTNGTPWIRWFFAPLFWIWNWAWVFLSPPSTAQVTQDGGQSPAARTEPHASANQRCTQLKLNMLTIFPYS